MKSTVEVHCVGFSTDPDCFQCSPLPEASCCPVNPCFLPVDVVIGGVGMYSYPVLLIPLLYCLLVFTYSGLQCSFGLSNVYLTTILAGDLVDHFLLPLFWHLLLHRALLRRCQKRGRRKWSTRFPARIVVRYTTAPDSLCCSLIRTASAFVLSSEQHSSVSGRDTFINLLTGFGKSRIFDRLLDRGECKRLQHREASERETDITIYKATLHSRWRRPKRTM